MKRFLAWLVATFIRLLGYTMRVTVEDRAGVINQPDREPIIIAFWHNRIALVPVFYERYGRGRTMLTFISRSRDGQFITDVASFFRVKAVRGSSSRHGASAALSAIKASHDSKLDLAITPDGPRGPRYEIHPGLLHLAQVTQRAIVPVTYRLDWKYELDSWDRFQVPIPFSRCHLFIGEPIFVPKEATESELADIQAKVSKSLGGD